MINCNCENNKEEIVILVKFLKKDKGIIILNLCLLSLQI